MKAIKGRQREYMEKDGEEDVLAMLHGNLRTLSLEVFQSQVDKALSNLS